MIIEGEDGVTHINVYSKGKTALGKWLSNFSKSIIYTEDGVFNSVEGYWYWILTGNDNLRELSGYKAKELGKTLAKKNEIDIEKIKRAIDIKLKSNYTKSFAESTLPFCHYYEYGGKRVDAGYEWIIEHLELRRKQLKDYYERQ